MNTELSGIIPPLLTTFDENEEIDEQAMRQEIRYMLDAGVDGITVGGSSGEGEKLSVEESCRLAGIVIDEVDGAVPVIMGVIRDSTRDVIRYGQALREIPGLYGLQITPVHYSKPSRKPGMLQYYRDIGDAVQMPIIIYNVVRWNLIDVDTLLELAGQEWVVAVKQSAGDIERLANLVAKVHATNSPLRVFSAIDTLLYPSFLLGAHGAVASIVTVLPRLTVALWRATLAGDHERARELHERILPVIMLMRTYQGDRLASLKAAVQVQGRRVGPARRPDMPLSAAELAAFQEVVDASGEASGQFTTPAAVG
jgi:4-hydroxy-tetrahydrodipicolinate synthase